ncbi:MAG: 5-formyltetrahydrofolate cyclo-ligase, partial [Proteobacteria bacterium]|nr:5-formyltetrahydrofolate cyclo-ligase [Pseudomonadota bacterium]
MPLNDEKQELRQAAKEKRHAAAAVAGPGAAAKMAANYFRAAPGFGSPETSAISGYWPMADELDVRPLLERLDGEGRALALPVVVAKGEPLIFRRWRPGMALDEGGF